jgi:hypothetical protein
MTEAYKAERTISAVFKEQKQIDEVIRRLIERGVSSDHISVMGRNFQSETRIAGFISKRDVILGGLRTGAIFGSLFGSFLSLLSGVGVLFIPFVGPIVAAGPIGAVLLGAACDRSFVPVLVWCQFSPHWVCQKIKPLFIKLGYKLANF